MALPIRDDLPDDLIALPRPGEAGRGSSTSQAALASHLAVESARWLRQRLSLPLIAAGLLVWIAAAWPRSLPPPLGAIVLVARGGALGAFSAALLAEWSRHRRRERFLVESGRPRDPRGS